MGEDEGSGSVHAYVRFVMAVVGAVGGLRWMCRIDGCCCCISMHQDEVTQRCQQHVISQQR